MIVCLLCQFVKIRVNDCVVQQQVSISSVAMLQSQKLELLTTWC